MAELSQKEFAELFDSAMRRTKTRNTELSKVTGLDKRTISRYRDPGYEFGPPSAGVRRDLERGLGLQRGALDGARAAVLHESGPVYGGGWEDASEAEERFRDMLRHVERTMRGMATQLDLSDPIERRKVQMGIVAGYILSREATMLPVPRFLRQIATELEEDRFR